MAFKDFDPTPRSISYLDLYVYAGEQAHASEATIQKINDYSKDVIFGLPQLPYKVILRCLHEMGVDTSKEVEEIVCWHKPICLSVSSRRLDKPRIYGLMYCGFERTDNEYKRENGLNSL